MNYKGFHHLTWNDRLTIEKMLKVRTAKAKIAEALGVSVRTIYYEIKRGMCTQRNTDYTVEERYCAEVAERAYREHLKAKGPDLKIGNNIELSNFLEEQIIEHHFSPGAALVEAKAANKVVNICESTLYNYIYRGDVFLLRSTCMKRANGTIPNNAAKKPRERQKVKASNTARMKSSSAPLLEIGRWTA